MSNLQEEKQKYWLKLTPKEVLIIGERRKRDPRNRKYMFIAIAVAFLGLIGVVTSGIPEKTQQYLIILPFLIVFIVWAFIIHKNEKAAKAFLEQVENEKHDNHEIYR